MNSEVPPPIIPEIPSPAADSSDKLLAILCHISFFFLSLILPLIVYLVKKDESGFVRFHAAEALNFHITLILASLCCIPLCFLVIGFPLLLLISLCGVIFTIIAAVKTGDGIAYRYPVCLRLIS